MSFSNNKIHYHGYDPASDAYKGSSAAKYNKDPDMYCAFAYTDPTISGNNVSVTVDTCWLLSTDTDNAYFGHGIHMRAIIGGVASSDLLYKPAGTSTWGSDDYKLKSPVTVTAPIPANGKIHFAIQVKCDDCGCPGQNDWVDIKGEDLTLGHTIIWDAFGGTFPDTGLDTKTSTNVPAGQPMSNYIPKTNPSVSADIVFDRWTTDSDGTHPIPSTTPNNDVRYYAQYVVKTEVNFNYAGGKDNQGSTSRLIIANSGDKVKYDRIVSRTGYDFVGWKAEWGDNHIYKDMAAVIDTSSGLGRYNLTAQWKLQDRGKILYETYGGEPEPPPQVITTDPSSYTVSKLVPKKKITLILDPQGGTVNPSKFILEMVCKGYFKGTGHVLYKFGDTIKPPPTTGFTLYAQYDPAAYLGPNPTPTRSDGAKFIGWFSNPDGTGKELKPGDTFTEDATYYAQWEQKLVYNANGATREGGAQGQSNTYPDVEQEISAAKVKMLTQDETFPDASWEFLGWSTNKNASTPQWPAGRTNKYTGSGGTIYAIWKKPDVTVTFNYKGGLDGSNSSGPKKVKVPWGGSATPPTGMHWPNTAGKKPKEFQGWMGKYTNVTYNTTVYAMWEGSPIKIWTGTKWIPYFAGVALTEWNGGN